MNIYRCIIIALLLSLTGIRSYAQNPQEILDTARAHYEREEYESAAGLFYRLAKEGYPQGMLEIAFMLRDGIGIEKNEDKALEYFEEAAEKGLTYSFQPLAELYHKKDMVEEAVVFYKMAIKEFPENNKRLAIIYFDDENYEEALPYVKKIARENDPDGVFLLGVMMYEGFGVEANEKAARKHLRKAAEMGHPGAVNFLMEIDRDEEPEEDYDTHYDEDE